jgi:hypothetical protein
VCTAVAQIMRQKTFGLALITKGNPNLVKNVGAIDKNVLMTQEQFNAILERFLQNPKSGKRKVRDITQEDSEAEIVEMFSPKSTISTVDTKDNSDASSIYFDQHSSEICSFNRYNVVTR